MKTFKKTVVYVSGSFLLSTVFLVNSFAHGGEDHGEKKVVTPTGQMNVKMAESDAIEVLIKYPTPKPAEEITLLVFLTDLKTNAPIGGAKPSLVINPVDSSQPPKGNSSNVHAAPQSVGTAALPTDTPGIYQAKVTFPELGQYSLALKLGGENPAAEVNITGIVVPGPEVQAEGEKTLGGKRLPLVIAAAAFFTLAGAMSYLFWVRPRRTGQAAEATAIYTAVEENKR